MSKKKIEIQEMTSREFSKFAIGLSKKGIYGTSPDLMNGNADVMVVREGISMADEDIVAKVRIVG